MFLYWLSINLAWNLLTIQILDPLRAMITGPPLEDARHLAQRYSRMRQEAESLVLKVFILFAVVCRSGLLHLTVLV